MGTPSGLVQRIDRVIEAVEAMEQEHRGLIESVHPDQRPGARNLVHYLALRRQDFGALQTELDRLGLTQLSSDLAHVAASLAAVRRAAGRLLGDEVRATPPGFEEPRRFAEGHERLRRLAAEAFGAPDDGSMPGIMVTMPTEVGYEPTMVRDMLEAGMTCARINCTQDDRATWTAMLENVRASEAETGLGCRVFMDLGGPKMRTGSMVPGPRVIRVRPPKDDRGRIVYPIPVLLLAQRDAPTIRGSGYDPTTQRYWTYAREAWLEPWLPLATDFLDAVRAGHRIALTDTRGHRVELPVTERPDGSLYALASERFYLETGLDLTLLDGDGQVVTTDRIGEYPHLDSVIVLRVGDELILHKDPRPGEPARYDQDGRLIERAHISCTLPDTLDQLRIGDPVLLDDGKIRNVVKERTGEHVVLEVTHARPAGTRLRGNKGINIPETAHRSRGLTPTDIDDLEYIVANASGVQLSFVNTEEDVLELYQRLDQLGAHDIDVVLKIETSSGFANLPRILMAAMRRPRVGLMIARGDLAVEAGWRNLSRLTEEMMWLAEAAHVPVIWATQVLARMTKTGQPTRAELTDVNRAHRAECIMLNKGPFLIETIRGLRTLLEATVGHQARKTQLLGPCEFEELTDPASTPRET